MKALALTVWTWLWLLPISGFHHMYRFGLLGWGILDCEAMDDAEGGGLVFRWSAGLLAPSLAACVAGLFIGRKLLRLRGRSP